VSSRRVIKRRPDGRWAVRLEKRNGQVLSMHDRWSDAVARATTILDQSGGGEWVVVDEAGKVIKEGKVASGG
jgi:uncharacterized protein DUF2188